MISAGDLAQDAAEREWETMTDDERAAGEAAYAAALADQAEHAQAAHIVAEDARVAAGQFAPGDRVHVRLATATGRTTTRIATVTRTDADAVRIELADGGGLVVGPDALTLLPPAKRRAPGAGRPTSTATLRVGDVLAVRDVLPDGTTPMRRYTVASVEDTADGLRLELAGEDGGAGMVVAR